MKTIKVIRIRGIINKTIGLINKNPKNILFKTRFGVHTFGMSYPIDVLILDSENKVIALKSELLPNRVFLWNPKYDTVIEMPAKTIKSYRIELGMILKIEFI